MRDTVRQGGSTVSGDAAGVNVHRKSASEGSKVGGPTTTLGGLYVGNWIRGGCHTLALNVQNTFIF